MRSQLICLPFYLDAALARWACRVKRPTAATCEAPIPR
jgi:hypothetical protein